MCVKTVPYIITWPFHCIGYGDSKASYTQRASMGYCLFMLDIFWVGESRSLLGKKFSRDIGRFPPRPMFGKLFRILSLHAFFILKETTFWGFFYLKPLYLLHGNWLMASMVDFSFSRPGCWGQRILLCFRNQLSLWFIIFQADGGCNWLKILIGNYMEIASPSLVSGMGVWNFFFFL